MHIKDHNDAMTFFRNSKQLESNGKWKEFVEESKFDDMLQESRPMAEGGRIGFLKGKLVTQGANKEKWVVKDFYTKSDGVFPNPDGSGIRDKFFNTEGATRRAINLRNKEMFHLTGRSGVNYDSKYAVEIKEAGYSSWDEVPKAKRPNLTSKYHYRHKKKRPPPKWKEEGLTTRLNERTRQLLATKKPINPATGLPYTVKEFTDLGRGQKNKLLSRLEGKEPTRAWAKRQGWYPEKKANKLMTYLKHAAKKQENLPFKERNLINVWEGEKFVGVKDVRKNTLYTHIDYDLSKKGAKEGTIITKHPGHENVQHFLKEAEKFKYERPNKLLSSYFSKYEKVPTYSEMYRFFTVSPETAGAKSGKAYQFNPLQLHHQELMAKEPAKSIQLTLSKQNTEASRILNQFEKGAKGYSFTEANQKLKDLGVRIKGSQGWMGPAEGEITTAKSLKEAQAETIKMFKEAHKNNPKIVDQMTKALNIAKTAKGPGRLKALQYLITLGGAGFVTALGFSPTEVQAAEAEAAEPGAAADMSKWMFESGLTFGEKAKVIGTAAIGDVLVNKSKISKAFLRWLPFAWTPAGDVVLHKLLSGKEPALEDFAEGLKAGGYDINSEEFKKAWNTIPEEDRKEMLYDWSGKVIDKRSTSEKIKETAASPWTHVTYAFWKPGVESMKRALQYDPGNKTLAKKWALRAIRMGMPMKIISAVNPVGWALTGATVVNAIREGTTQEDWRPEPLTQPEWGGHEPVESAQTVTDLLRGYQEKHVPKDQRDKFTIDYSLPEKFVGGGPVRLTRTVAPDSEGIMSLKKKKW